MNFVLKPDEIDLLLDAMTYYLTQDLSPSALRQVATLLERLEIAQLYMQRGTASLGPANEP